MSFMIYGANGYTGELIAREAKERGLSPVLAGRNATKIAALAGELGFEHRVFGVASAEDIGDQLQGMDVVLHCAGPFSATSRGMLEGCLRARAHYLDITGEIAVIEHAHAQDERAREAGIVVCPGVGFDVIPTDCVALALSQALPDATHLALGFHSRSGLSPGTAKSSVEGLALGGRVRKDGQIVAVPLGHEARRIDFGDGERFAITIPWGDVATAYHTTGIPNIQVFVSGPEWIMKNAKRAHRLRWLLGWAPVQALLKSKAAREKGPNAEQRAKLPTYVWGEARNAAGHTKTARIVTANGYSVTVSGSLHVVDTLLDLRRRGEAPPSGSTTPAKLLGADLVTKLPGSGPLTLA